MNLETIILFTFSLIVRKMFPGFKFCWFYLLIFNVLGNFIIFSPCSRKTYEVKGEKQMYFLFGKKQIFPANYQKSVSRFRHFRFTNERKHLYQVIPSKQWKDSKYFLIFYFFTNLIRLTSWLVIFSGILVLICLRCDPWRLLVFPYS